MTEQSPPSAEARLIAYDQRVFIPESVRQHIAREIDALCEQRVSAAVREYQTVVTAAQCLIDEAAVDIGDGTASAEEKNLHAALAAIRAPSARLR